MEAYPTREQIRQADKAIVERVKNMPPEEVKRQEMELADLDRFRHQLDSHDAVQFLKDKFPCTFTENSRQFRQLTADGGLNYALVVIKSGHSLEECINLPWFKYDHYTWVQKKPNGKAFGVYRRVDYESIKEFFVNEEVSSPDQVHGYWRWYKNDEKYEGITFDGEDYSYVKEVYDSGKKEIY